MIELRVVGVRIELPHQQPVLILTEQTGRRSLPIMIGSAEATAIAMQLQGVTPPRPLTHDLFKDALVALGQPLTEVRVVDFRDGTFYGELVFGSDLVVSARPSDAVALAIRLQVPIRADERVMDEAGIVIPEADETDAADLAGETAPGAAPVVDPEREMAQFREFLDNVTPEDFDPQQPDQQ